MLSFLSMSRSLTRCPLSRLLSPIIKRGSIAYADVLGHTGHGHNHKVSRNLTIPALLLQSNANAPHFQGSWSFNNSIRTFSTNVQNVLFKKATHNTSSSKKDETYGDEEVEILGRGDKVLKVKLATTRLDGILKIGLQISKNKIEKAFYEDRIRVNGERPKKKSQQLMEGAEVDIVRGKNKINENFLDVSRVEIVKLGEDSGENDEYESDEDESDYKFPAILKRYKSLTIENYAPPGTWKGPVSDS